MLNSFPSILIVALEVIGGFSLLVLIHEFGHFIVAKKLGVWVEEFGLGLPPRIWSKQIGETLYSINLLPIGGFVKLHGETGDEKTSDPKRSFVNQSKKTRIAISLAGIVMNLFLAVVCFAIVYSVNGIATGKVSVKILEIATSSPAQIKGFKVGDVVKKVGTKDVLSVEEFKTEVDLYKGKNVVIEVERELANEKRNEKISIMPRIDPPANEGSLGVTIADVPEIYFPPIWARPFVGAYWGAKEALNSSVAVVKAFFGIAQNVSHGQAPEHLVGVVGILAIFVDFARRGLLFVINLVGIVSINLAIFNLIPFPPLDGSRVLFILLEGIVGKKLLSKIENSFHTVGFILLLGLMVLLSFKEIPMLIKSGSISNFVNNLVK